MYICYFRSTQNVKIRHVFYELLYNDPFRFLLIPTALSTAHSVFPLYCARLLNIDSLGVSGWTFSDVLLSATLLLNVIFCVVRHHTIRHAEIPFWTRYDTSLSAHRAATSLLRAVLHCVRLHTITHVNNHSWLHCDTSRSVPRAAASLLRAVLRFARHHTVRRVNRHTWTRCVTSISADVTSDRQSCARSHVACMQCDHNRESPPSAVWHSPTYHQRTIHAATHVVTLLSLPPTNITRQLSKNTDSMRKTAEKRAFSDVQLPFCRKAVHPNVFSLLPHPRLVSPRLATYNR